MTNNTQAKLVSLEQRQYICVEACTGLSNEALEAGVIKDMIEAVRQFKIELDGLFDTHCISELGKANRKKVADILNRINQTKP